MSYNRLLTMRQLLLVGAAAFALVPEGTLAQTAPDTTAEQPSLPPGAGAPGAATDANAPASSEIVVTGTSLRGVAPAGAESLQISQTDVVASGATSTQQLLADIPQLSTFASTPYSGVGGTQLTINRENLRNLPLGTGGGSPTLILMDGHRFAGDSIKQTVPDAGIIPPGMIDHVEVVLDGGSAVYGADAIGGVLNFITKRDFDGIQVNATHGFGEEYNTTNIDFLTGKKWDSGSIYIGYSYAYNSAISNANRSFERQVSYTGGVAALASQQCNAGNVVAGGATYAITGTNPVAFTPGNQNLCDASKYGTFYPQEIRHSVMAGFRQDITPSLDVDVKGFYSYRKDTLFGADSFSATESGASSPGYPAFGIAPSYPTPGYIPVTPGGTATETVYGNFFSVNGNHVPGVTKLTTWGITPTLNWKIGGDWHMKAFYNVGGSRTTVNDSGVNANLLAADVAAGTFNPYNPGAASNAAVIPAILDYDSYGLGVNHLDNAKVVFDGSVFRLPGGVVKVAIGGEYLRQSWRGIFSATGTPQQVTDTSLNPLSSYVQSEGSGFGEINLPLISSFVVDLQERYDHYSDFGGNWAPSVGAQFKPVDWITLRGKWNKAFQAPSPANLANAGASATGYSGTLLEFVPLLVNPSPNTLLGTLGGGGRTGAVYLNPFISLQGSNPNLQPQRATTYDLGIDLSPPVVPGLGLHLTYYHIKYLGVIGMPPQGSNSDFWTAFPGSYAMNPTYAQVIAIMRAAGVSAAQIANTLASSGISCSPASCNLYSISNVLITNLGGAKVSGLDIGADYRRPTSFGSIYAKFNGTYQLNYQTAPSPTAPYTTNGVGNSITGILIPRFNFVGVLGATVGQNFLAQIKWNHTDGGNVAAFNLGLGQVTQSSYDTFDLFAKYDLKQGNWPPISLTLTVTNLFDADPPVFNGSNGLQNGYADGTLGRVVQLGASVKF